MAMAKSAVLASAMLAAACHDWQALSRGTAEDSGAVDANGDSGSSSECGSRGPSTCGAGVVACDGFDDATLRTMWTPLLSAGTVGTTTDCVYRGARSLALHVDPASVGAVLQAAVVARDAVTLPAHFVRAYFLARSPKPTVDLKLLRIEQNGGTNLGVTLRVTSGAIVVYNQVSGQAITTTADLPFDRWVCLELGVISGAPGTVRAWKDDALIFDQAQTTATSPDLSVVSVGIGGTDVVGAPETTPIDIFADEWALDQAHVGCIR
jgi:hypothetical protein